MYWDGLSCITSHNNGLSRGPMPVIIRFRRNEIADYLRSKDLNKEVIGHIQPPKPVGP
jgi:hypothetical protein